MGAKQRKDTAKLARTLDRLIVGLMLAITAALAWPLGLILHTSARPDSDRSRIALRTETQASGAAGRLPTANDASPQTE